MQKTEFKKIFIELGAKGYCYTDPKIAGATYYLTAGQYEISWQDGDYLIIIKKPGEFFTAKLTNLTPADFTSFINKQKGA